MNHLSRVAKNSAFLLLIIITTLLFTACSQPKEPNTVKDQQPDKTGLFEKINEAQGLYDSLEISVNGDDVNENNFWVTSIEKAKLEFALEDAWFVYNNPDATQEEIDLAFQDLTNAYEKIIEDKQPGQIKDPNDDDPIDDDPIDEDPIDDDPIDDDPIDDDPIDDDPIDDDPIDDDPIDDDPIDDNPTADKEELKTAIAAANEKMPGVKKSEDGSELLITQYWASGEMFAALLEAIAGAEELYKDALAVQEDVNDMTAELLAAVSAFVPQRGLLTAGGISYIFSGPKDETITLVGKVSLSWAKNDELQVSVSETYDSYQWYVDGVIRNGQTGNSITLRARDFSVNTHSVTLQVRKNGVPYTKTLYFGVE